MQQLAETQMHEVEPESVDIPGTQLRVSRVALGTWAMGRLDVGAEPTSANRSPQSGPLWSRVINLIDTAPVYGFGVSEEIVGQAVGAGRSALTGSHCHQSGPGMARDGKVYRNATRDRIMREIDDSLRRLRTDHIDIYQVHWPDPLVPIEETAEAMRTLYDQGKIRAIGVSNFSVRTDGALPPGCASARAAATLQSLRASHRSADSPLLPREQHRDARVWRALSRAVERPDAGRHHLRR